MEYLLDVTGIAAGLLLVWWIEAGRHAAKITVRK